MNYWKGGAADVLIAEQSSNSRQQYFLEKKTKTVSKK